MLNCSDPAVIRTTVKLLLDTFLDFIIWTLFSIMFSSEANTSEAARDRWCCQLCVKLVTELSTQCSSHLRSWQPTVVSEQQTHFSITPLSLIPPLLSFCPFSAHFIWHSSSAHSSHPLSSLLSLLRNLLPSRLPYFLTCALLSSVVRFCCQPSIQTEHTARFLLLA